MSKTQPSQASSLLQLVVGAISSNSDLRQLGTGLFRDITPSLLQMSDIPKTFCLSSPGIGPEIDHGYLAIFEDPPQPPPNTGQVLYH